MLIKEEILKDRLTLFFDTNTYNIINTKQKRIYTNTQEKIL